LGAPVISGVGRGPPQVFFFLKIYKKTRTLVFMCGLILETAKKGGTHGGKKDCLFYGEGPFFGFGGAENNWGEREGEGLEGVGEAGRGVPPGGEGGKFYFLLPVLRFFRVSFCLPAPSFFGGKKGEVLGGGSLETKPGAPGNPPFGFPNPFQFSFNPKFSSGDFPGDKCTFWGAEFFFVGPLVKKKSGGGGGAVGGGGGPGASIFRGGGGGGKP